MIKLFEDFNERNAHIDLICTQYGIEYYTINADGTIDVDGDVNLSYMKISTLPLKFRRVSGDFLCNDNKLTTLDGSPTYVGWYFSCNHNLLTNLKFAPKEVGVAFFFAGNLLPHPVYDNGDSGKYIVANQDDYGIWNTDGSLNEVRFNLMMKEKDI